MVVLRVSFNGLLHKSLGERIGVVPWSEPPRGIAPNRLEAREVDCHGAMDVYEKENGQSATVPLFFIQPTNVHDYLAQGKRDAFRRLRDKLVSDSRTGLELPYFEVGK